MSTPCGSPAGAGMDRSRSTADPARPGLPRRRGDGPRGGGGRSARTSAPPQARGWTWVGDGGLQCLDGSPAGAGMDPSGVKDFPAGKGLPRRRGDGPLRRRGSTAPFQAPPQARGWTRRELPRPRQRRGSPAGAGMDPAPHRARGARRRLPRRRGDGPAVWPGLICGGWAPPQARGWTRRHGRRSRRQGGSPAGAGMDPLKQIGSKRGVRLPRRRGDGPTFSGAVIRLRSAPPQARGWTRGSLRSPEPDGGSPAGAGMDRHSQLSSWM